MIRQPWCIRVFAATLTTLPGLAPVAFAHDSWLVADAQSLESGNPARVSFLTGEIFPKGDAVTTPDRIADFDVIFGGRRTGVEVVQLDGNALRANCSMSNEGFHVIGCNLRPRLITMTSTDFDAYLADEEARGVLDLRRQRGDAAQTVTEQYTKLTKTIVRVGAPKKSDRGFEARLGQRLEIVPMSDPFEWRSGGTARVQVLLDGHPWSDIVISAGHEGLGRHEYVYRGKTNAEGEASIPLSAGGRWFIKAYHIREASPLADYAWESLWSSLTFMVQGESEKVSVLVPALKPFTAQDAQKSDIADDIRAITAIHGELSPFAALGFRMGRRALSEFDLNPGDHRLLAIYRTPFALPYSAAADGIQAATRVSIGRLTLLIAKADPNSIQAEFIDQESGVTIQCQPTPAILTEIIRLGAGSGAENLATLILKMSDDELFTLTAAHADERGARLPSCPMPESKDQRQLSRVRSVTESRRIRSSIRVMGLSEALSSGCEAEE